MSTVLDRVRTLTARDVMSAPAVTVGPDASPWAAWTTMTQHGIRHLVVTAGGRCVGMLEDREVFAQWPLGPLALRRARIATMMRTRIGRVLPDAPLPEVARLMVMDAVDAVPVVDADGTLLGVVTGGDVIAAVARGGGRNGLTDA